MRNCSQALDNVCDSAQHLTQSWTLFNFLEWGSSLQNVSVWGAVSGAGERHIKNPHLRSLPNKEGSRGRWFQYAIVVFVQSLGRVQLSSPRDCGRYSRHPCPSLSPGVCSNSWSLPESVMPSNCLIFCHPLLFLSSISQHQGLFQRVSSSHQVEKVLELQFQYHSFQWIFRTDFL